MKIADDLDYAIRATVALGERADEWREEQFRQLKAFSLAVRGRRAGLDAARGLASSKVATHVRLERIDLTTHAVGWPDVKFAEMAGKGATVTGEIPVTGIYRTANVQATVDMDTFDA